VAKKIPPEINNLQSKISKSQTLRVIIVEDSEDDALLLIRKLKEGGYDPVYERVENVAAMKKAIKEKQWDIILCDYKMPNFSAPSAIAVLKKLNIDIPIIIVSGAIGEEMAIECMRSGAQDYIMKSSLSRLCPAIYRELEEAKVRKKQKHTEEKLHREEQRFRALAEQSSDIIALVDPEGTALYENPAVEKSLGIKPEERIGKKVFENVHPDDLNIITDSFNALLKDKNVPVKATKEVRIRHSDGSWRTFEIAASNMVKNNVIEAIIVNLRDITQRKLAEKAFRESEIKYKLIAEKMTDIVWVTDMALRVIYATPSVHTVLGFTQEEIMNQTLEEKLTPDSLSFGLETMGRELAIEEQGLEDPNRTVNLVLEYYHKDGSTRWLETIISGIRDENGGLTAIHGVSRDITQRKFAEEKLRKSEELFTKLVNTIPDIIVRTDLKGKITFINDNAMRISGYRREEMEGQNILKFVVPQEHEYVKKNIKLLNEGKLAPREYNLLTKDGREIPFEINGDVLRKEDGTPFATVHVCRNISERKLVVKSLRRSEEKYRTIIENIEDGYAELDLKGNFLFVNDALCKIDGYPKDEIIKLNYRDIMDEENAKKIYAAYHKVFITGEPERNFEYEIITKNGIVKYLETSVSPIKDADNHVIAFRGIVRDRTEHKKAEDKFRKIFMTTPDCIVISRISDGIIIDVNKGFEDIVGWKREQVIGMRSTDPAFNFWVDLSERSFIYADLKAGRDVLNQEFKFRRSDGSVRSGICSARPITIGEEECILFILQDITERKLAEEKFHKIFMTNPNCIAITRLKDGFIKDVNKGFEDIVGWKRDIAVGTKSSEPPLNFWVDIAERDFMAAELRKGRDVFHRQIEFRRSDGSVRTGIYSARPINIDGDESIIFILQDITEQNRMERELIESQKTRLMNQIASGVAHEVRNPLHAIQAISEAMAIDMDEKSDYRDYLMHIKAQVGRLSHLMNDLLDLGKPIQSSLFSQALLADIVTASMGYWMEAHPQLSQQIKIVNKLEHDGLVLADSNKIQQVIINLIENAAQSSSKDEEILLELSSASESYLMVKVIDRGVGLKSQDQSKVFEPFYTTRKGGTGLGLSLCKHIIENHGGMIEIVNNRDTPGCTARFTIPACKGA
jgi:PAS domain S-box-containing protein